MPDEADELNDAPSLTEEPLRQEESLDAPASIDVIGKNQGRSPSHRIKKSNWKFHLASVSILLAIVGVFFWVNRNAGGRRAAGATSPVSSPKALSSSPNASSSNIDPKTAEESKPTDSGSGLGLGLGGKFDQVLGDIAKQREGPQPNDPTNADSDEDWQALPGFPADLRANFQSSSGWDWAKITANQIEILPLAEVKSGVRISKVGWVLEPGDSITIQTSLSTKMPKEVAVGFLIGRSAVVLKSESKRVNLTARLAGEEKSRVLLAVDQPNAPMRLDVHRSADEHGVIRFTISSDDKRQSTEVTLSSLEPKTAVTLLVGPPRKTMGRKFWIADLKTLR